MAKKKTEEEYLKKFNSIHQNKYTYLPFPQIFNQHTKIKIVCPVHGEFEQIICNHANGMGCPKCGKENMSKTKVLSNNKRDNYIKKIIENYGDIYDFSETDFNVPYDDKVKVVCKHCNRSQEKRISDLIKNKAGCSFCRIPNMQKTYYSKLKELGKENFLKKAKELYNNKYSYEEIDYKGLQVPVKIICPIHGEFYKTPANHIYGLCECPQCRAETNYSKYEEYTARLLNRLNCEYISQFVYKNNNYLKNKPFDFYIAKKNLLIEIDGPQHRECCWDMTTEDLRKRQEIDKIKTEKAVECGFNIVRISTDDDIEKILKEKLDK